MRGTLSVLFLLAAALPAVAQPSATPPLADTADAPEGPYAQPYAQVSHAPTYYYPAPAPILIAPARRPRGAEGVYFTESFGGTSFSDDISRHMSGAIRLRAALGYRRNKLAFEVWAAGGIGWSSHDSYASSGRALSQTGTTEPSPEGGHHHGGTGGIGMVGIDAKYIKTVSRNFEVYAKGGLSRAWAGDLGSGPGIGLGGGVQLKGKVPVIGFLFWPLFFTGLGPKCTAAVFAETSYEFYRLHGHSGSTDAQLRNWTLGFAVGSDF